nr:MAG TPA: hypothetical protein [Caudoviricetes sp.]
MCPSHYYAIHRTKEHKRTSTKQRTKINKILCDAARRMSRHNCAICQETVQSLVKRAIIWITTRQSLCNIVKRRMARLRSA